MARRPRNYYQLLGVPPDASRQEIHSAYRRLARRYHPDVNAGGDAGARFNEVSDAYEVLHDPAQRAHYDRSGDLGDAAAAVDTASAAVSQARRGVTQAPKPVSHAPTARQVPFFSAARPGRDVPRFLDEEPGVVEARFGHGRGVRVQLLVRWLR